MTASQPALATEPLPRPSLGPPQQREARFLLRRLPLFASAWLASSATWSGLLVFDEHFGFLSITAALLAQTLVAGVALRARSLVTTASGARALAVALAVVLGWIVLALFAVGRGSRDILTVMLLTLYVVPAFTFGWGWGPTVVVQLATALPALALLPAFTPTTRPVELAVAFGIGAAIAIAVAEGAARNVRMAQRHRHAAETRTRELLESRDAYRDLAENVQDLIWAFDRDGRWTYINAAMERFFGKPRAAMIGQSILDVLVPGSPSPNFQEGLARVAAGAPARIVRIHCATASGPRWIEAFGSGVVGADGTLMGMRGVGRDVTERERAEVALHESLDELRRSEERLRHLARRQAQIREDERKRLGFDLHDGVCQELIGIAILVHSVRERLLLAQQPGAEILERATGYLHSVVEHLRILARELRPMMLQDLGLADSLTSLAAGMASPERAVTVRIASPIPRLPDDLELAVYRIAQEALTNAVRHADAHAIVATLTREDGNLRLEVRDDGCGFDVASRSHEALGLTGMQERAAALGGMLTVESTAGQGTVVMLACPVDAAARHPVA